MDRDNKYNSANVTLGEVIQSNCVPEVVRVFKDAGYDPDVGYRFYSKLEINTELFLQKTQRVKYARIKILKFYDNKQAEKEKGPEYVLEHETYVGEEFFIPYKYPGKLKFVYRPGSRRRFATISQILEESPRYIKVEEKTPSLLANDLDTKTYIPAKTTLEVVRKFYSNQECFLECREGKTAYAFNVDDHVNFTEVEDPKQYNLFELARFMLPKVMLFDTPSPEDAILVDKELNSAVLTSMEGPLELLGFQEVDLLVAWVRDKQSKVYRTVLIPKGAWNNLFVQNRCFVDKGDKDSYISRKFGPCRQSDFIEKYMYMMPLDQTLVTWLRNPEFYTGPRNEMEMYSHLPVLFRDSSDDEDVDDYIEMPEEPPPLPPHLPVPAERKPKDFKPQKFQKLREIKDKLLHKHRRPLAEAKKENPPPRPPKASGLVPSTLMQLANKGFTQSTFTLADRAVYSGSVSESELKFLPRSSSENDIDINRNEKEVWNDSYSSDSYDYLDIEPVLTVFNRSIHANSERPLPPIPVASEVTNSSKNKQPKYVSLKSQNAAHLFESKLTASDFFMYTVVEVEHCFNMCGLTDFASKCLEQQLDGHFFENFNLQDLKNRPFNLTDFQILKLNKMIYEGWRPNVCNEDPRD